MALSRCDFHDHATAAKGPSGFDDQLDLGVPSCLRHGVALQSGLDQAACQPHRAGCPTQGLVTNLG